MSTHVERSCVEQCFGLARGFNWDKLATRRARGAVFQILVPTALAPAFGSYLPNVGGMPPKHP